MIDKKSIILFFLILFLFPLCLIASAEELKSKNLINKWFSAIGASKAMSYFENTMMSKVYNVMWRYASDNDLAKEEYQILGKEAQVALGIPNEYHVPIKKYSSLMQRILNSAGLTIPGSIYANEYQLDRTYYGQKRSVLFHEAVHRKYNDVSLEQIMGIFMTSFGLALACNILPKCLINRFSILHKDEYRFMMLLLYYSVCLIILKNYAKYVERRADLESSFATKCWVCVKQEANSRYYVFEVMKSPSKDDGYLHANDLRTIAEDLKSQGALCPHHAACQGEFYD